MDAIQQTIEALSLHFNTQMEEFQKSLQGAIPAASPTSNIAGQFNSFRTFVLTALAGLQKQVELLAKQNDQLETRSRRKMLLVHGISEGSVDKLKSTVSSTLSKQLNLPDLSENCLTRCQRLGRPNDDKPRPILIKFQEMSSRNLVWFAKTALKGSGITLSEFLTKSRHEAFLAARLKYGVSKCYTRDGVIVVIGQDGTRHRVTSKTEVDSIPVHSDSQQSSTPVSTVNSAPKAPKAAKLPAPANSSERSKRNVRK